MYTLVQTTTYSNRFFLLWSRQRLLCGALWLVARNPFDITILSTVIGGSIVGTSWIFLGVFFRRQSSVHEVSFVINEVEIFNFFHIPSYVGSVFGVKRIEQCNPARRTSLCTVSAPINGVHVPKTYNHSPTHDSQWNDPKNKGRIRPTPPQVKDNVEGRELVQEPKHIGR